MLNGIYFDGKSARGIHVQIVCANDVIELRGDDVAITVLAIDVPIDHVTISPRLGRTRRQLSLPDGAICEVDDDPQLDEWFATATQRRWNLLAQLEAHWFAVATSAILIVGLVVALALWGLPWAAQKIALRMPQAWVDQLGGGALTALDETLGKETSLTAERQQTLRAKFIALARTADVAAKFEFRAWPKLGANALALPDSTIVMTDALVQLADDDRELLAVIAHELGHEHERHALQQILASSGVTALIFVMTGDVSGLANIAVMAPTVLTHMHHSRALERDADRYGFALLQRSGIEPIWFARMMRKLETARHEDAAEDDRYSSWLSTHPNSEERARAAERYANPTRD